MRTCILHSMVIAAAFVIFTGCAKSQDVFDDIGTNLASPSAMTIDVATNRLYVVNSNSEVLYDWRKGSFQVLDITAPLAPTIVDTAETASFSGGLYFDAVTKRAYIPNRFSEDNSSTVGRVYVINADEASADFMSYAEYESNNDPNGIACCYPAGRIWVTSYDNGIDYFAEGATITPANFSLVSPIEGGGSLNYAGSHHIAIIGNQAFISREYGGIMVANLDKVGLSAASPVDYFIGDFEAPRGIATDGTLIYVVGEGFEGDSWLRSLIILDPSSIPAVAGNNEANYIDKNDDGLLLARIDVGLNPQEVALSTDYAFVTNMDENTVSVISLATRTKIKDIIVGTSPYSMAVYTDGGGVDRYLYVGNLESNTISIIDIATLEVAATY